MVGSEQLGYYVELDIWHGQRNYAQEFFSYRDQSENSQFNLSAAIYREKLKANFDFNSDETLDNYLDLVMSLMNSSEIQGALNKAMSTLPMPSIGSRQLHIGKIMADLQGNTDKMNAYLKELNTVFNGILKTVSSISYEDLLAMSIDGEKLNPAIKRKLQKIWNTSLSSGVLEASDRYKDLSSRAKAQYRSLIMRVSRMADKGLYTGGGFNSKAMSDSSELTALLSPIVMFFQTLLGFASEYIIAENLNELTDKLISGGAKHPNVQVKVSASTVGTQSGGVFSTGTTDLAIKLTPAGGTISIDTNLPDIQASLKRTKVRQNGNIDIHIKDSSFGKLMQAILGNSFTASNLNAFYNLYAAQKKNAKYKGTDLGSGSSDFSINEVYNVMQEAMVVAAIAGSMTKEDLSMVLIVNDQVLSIYDILAAPEKYSMSGNKLTVKGTNLKNNRKSIQAMNTIPEGEALNEEKGKERSEAIIAAINAIAVKMSIELKIRGI